MSSLAANPSQRRRAERKRSLLAGKLSNADSSLTVDCTIRDLSDTGALVELVSPELLPKALRLLVIKEGVVRDAEVVWRRGNRMGLSLGERHDLRETSEKDLTDKQLRVLRAIWSHMALR